MNTSRPLGKRRWEVAALSHSLTHGVGGRCPGCYLPPPCHPNAGSHVHSCPTLHCCLPTSACYLRAHSRAPHGEQGSPSSILLPPGPPLPLSQPFTAAWDLPSTTGIDRRRECLRPKRTGTELLFCFVVNFHSCCCFCLSCRYISKELLFLTPYLCLRDALISKL